MTEKTITEPNHEGERRGVKGTDILLFETPIQRYCDPHLTHNWRTQLTRGKPTV